MTSFVDETREGKGRVHPGPSPSSSRVAVARIGAVWLAGTVLVLLAAVAVMVFGTQAHQYSSPAALAAVSAIGSLFGVAIVLGMPKLGADLRTWTTQLAVGAGGFALAPWIVMSNRFTDAPPGSEVVFFSVAAWGALLGIAVVASSPQRLSRIGGMVLSLAATAGVVANWERPSSFSPLVRYAREEVLMLVAGALWVALVLVLQTAARRKALRAAALRCAIGGAAAAAALAIVAFAGGSLAAADFAGSGLWAYGVASAFLAAGVVLVLRSGSALGIAGAYLLVPAAMSLLLLLEGIVGFRGPNPLVVVPILGAAAAGLAGLWVTGARAREGGCRRGVAPTMALAVAGLAVIASLVSMALPGMTATVIALRNDGSPFNASFTLHGYEVAGTWLALSLAVIALGMATEASHTRPGWPRVAAVVAAAAAWPFAGPTPLRTLTAFVPSEIQVDYGSEFARIDFSGGPPLLAAFALGGALIAVAVTLSCRPAPADGGTENQEAVSW